MGRSARWVAAAVPASDSPRAAPDHRSDSAQSRNDRTVADPWTDRDGPVPVACVAVARTIPCYRPSTVGRDRPGARCGSVHRPASRMLAVDQGCAACRPPASHYAACHHLASQPAATVRAACRRTVCHLVAGARVAGHRAGRRTVCRRAVCHRTVYPRTVCLHVACRRTVSSRTVCLHVVCRRTVCSRTVCSAWHRMAWHHAVDLLAARASATPLRFDAGPILPAPSALAASASPAVHPSRVVRSGRLHRDGCPAVADGPPSSSAVRRRRNGLPALVLGSLASSRRSLALGLGSPVLDLGSLASGLGFLAVGHALPASDRGLLSLPVAAPPDDDRIAPAVATRCAPSWRRRTSVADRDGFRRDASHGRVGSPSMRVARRWARGRRGRVTGLLR